MIKLPTLTPLGALLQTSSRTNTMFSKRAHYPCTRTVRPCCCCGSNLMLLSTKSINNLFTLNSQPLPCSVSERLINNSTSNGYYYVFNVNLESGSNSTSFQFLGGLNFFKLLCEIIRINSDSFTKIFNQITNLITGSRHGS